MADAAARAGQYEYKANSNLVLQVDFSLVDRRPKDEATGEVLSLSTRLPGKMGDRHLRNRPPMLDEKGAKRRRRDESQQESRRFKDKTLLNLGGLDEILGVYKPRTQETRQTYEVILSFIQDSLGDQPRDILCGAPDEVLAILKSDKVKDKERKKEVEMLLGALTEERYALLVNLGKKITDYSAAMGDEQRAGGKTGEEDIDETLGVNVQFEEEDEDEDDQEDAFGEIHGDESGDEIIEEGEETAGETTLKFRYSPTIFRHAP